MIRDEDAETPKWAEHNRFPTEGQAIAAAKVARQEGLKTQIKTVKVNVELPKEFVLWISSAKTGEKGWREGGLFQSRGEAVAAGRQAELSGLNTWIGERQGGVDSNLPMIQRPGRIEDKKRVKLYQVLQYKQNDWVVVKETYDPGVANDEMIRLKSKTNNETFRVASKEVLVDEESYRKAFPNSPR